MCASLCIAVSAVESNEVETNEVPIGYERISEALNRAELYWRHRQ